MKEFIDKLIEELKAESYFARPRGMETETVVEIGTAISIVNKLAEEYKVSEMPTGWIACSERLPKKKTWVLVTRKSGVVDIEELSAKGWICKIDEVIAWMPLPAPYTEGE